jgi:hypothetical protein
MSRELFEESEDLAVSAEPRIALVSAKVLVRADAEDQGQSGPA